MCVCVCVCVRVCVCIVTVKYFPCIWVVFISVFHWVVDVLLLILLNVFMIVNDEPESKFLYTETIKLYCIAWFEGHRFNVVYIISAPLASFDPFWLQMQ